MLASLLETLAKSKNSSMRPGSQGKPEEALVSSVSSALQSVRDEQQEEYGDPLETMESMCNTLEDISGGSLQVLARLGRMEVCMAALEGKLEANDTDIRTVHDTLWKRIQQRLDQLELNCNANIGEAIAAGIEEMREAELAAGKEMRDVVEAAVKRCDGDMRALQGEHAKSDRALKLQLHAVLEQARDMRVWREQHNIRLLEMQASLTAVEKKSKSALARTERLCEASMDSVRRGAAASLAMESRRLEGLLSGHATRFAEKASVPPLPKEEELAAPHNQVDYYKLPSPPSDINSIQSSSPPAPSSFTTWQKPHHTHSSVFTTAHRNEAVTEAVSSDSNRAVVVTLESELLQAKDVKALDVGHSKISREWQGAADAGGIVAHTKRLSHDQQGLGCKGETSPQMSVENMRGASDTPLLVSVHADQSEQLPAAQGEVSKVAKDSGSPMSDELAEVKCAEEVGPAQLWQTAVADVELPSPAAYLSTARGAHIGSASPGAADVPAAEPRAEASTVGQACTPCLAGRAPSEHAGPSDTAEASLQQKLAAALRGVDAGTCSVRSEEGFMFTVPHHRSALEACHLESTEGHAPALSAGACGSSPHQAQGVCAPSVACGCSARRCLRVRKRPRTKLSRMRRTSQELRALPSKRDQDADILAALLALQMAVSGHSTAILQLKQASQPQSCWSPPASPTQPRGLLHARLEVAWSGESSRGASSGLPSHDDSAAALPDSKRHDVGVLGVEREPGLPYQPSLAAATDGSGGSIHAAGRPTQADQTRLCHQSQTFPGCRPSAAAGAGRRPPSSPSSQERPSMKQGTKHDPGSFNSVLQGWHKERRLQASASKK